jgi:hypothetical protein
VTRGGTERQRKSPRYKSRLPYGLPEVVGGREPVVEAAEVTPHPARDGW